MKALLYLTKRSAVNSLKEAVRRPLSLLLIVFICAYTVFIVFTFSTIAVEVRINSPYGLFAGITLITFYFGLASYASYAGKKGIIFRKGHEQLVFTAPVSPKVILMQAAVLNYVMSFVLWVIIFICALTIFSVPFFKAALLFLFGFVFDICSEMAVIILLYGTDKMSERVQKFLRLCIWALLIIISAAIFLYFRKEGISLESIRSFFEWPGLRMFPVFGWMISSYHLILIGPDSLSIAGTVIYILFTIIVSVCAYRSKCTGEYFEEAAEFAESYAKMRDRKKRGEAVFSMNEDKRKLRRNAGKLGGTKASSIFFRQLLEYKKEKFFIFNKMTVVLAFILVIFTFSLTKGMSEDGARGIILYGKYMLLGVSAYIAFVASSAMGKVDIEIKRPYVYMIPDSNMKKLFYATLMEHISSVVHGVLFVVPIGIVWKVSPLYIVYDCILFVLFRGISVYTHMISDMVIGSLLGNMGRAMVKMFVLSLSMGIGAAISITAAFFIRIDFLFPFLTLYSIIIVILSFAVTSLRFRNMEQLD